MRLSKNLFISIMILTLMALVFTGCSSQQTTTNNSSQSGTQDSSKQDSGKQDSGQQASSGGEQKKDSGPVFLAFAGGPSSGVYGKAAAGISVVLKDKSGGKINATSQSTSGGSENITLVNTNQAQMGIVGSADIHEAYYGEGLWQGKEAKDFRIIGNSIIAVMNTTVLAKSEIKTFKDLEGKVLSLGSPGSASGSFMERFLDLSGMKVDRKFLAGGDGATALKDGQIDAYNWGPSVPAPDLLDLSSNTDIRLIDLGTPAKEMGFFEKYPYYQPYTVKAGTYKGVDYDVPTLQTGTFWIVHKDLPEDLVYEMTKLAYENTEALKQAFGALKVMTPDESAISGIDVPLHSGAAKFWTEKGVKIPAANEPVK